MKIFQFFSILFLGVTSVTFAQQSAVDFKSVEAFIELDTIQKSISGKVTYHLEVLEDTSQVQLDAKNMTFYEVQLNGKSVNHSNNNKQLQITEALTKGKYTLTFNYHVIPKQALYFIGWKSKSAKGFDSQIWSQGQGKCTSHWFPSLDDVNDKLIFNLTIKFPSKYRVIANGILEDKEVKADKTIWKYQMQQPMSSYLLALAIGKFENKSEHSHAHTPLEYYYESADKAKFEATYKHSKTVFNFLEKEIGIKYPWEIYRHIPVRDFIYAGMENTTTTIFSKEFMVDEKGYHDQNYLNINAHELAHQWFGNLVTAQSSTHHWLQEGFATYYALLAEKEILGEDFFYWSLFKSALELQEAPVGETSILLGEKGTSLTYYQKGAWALHVIKSQIGEVKFQKAVKSYLEKYAYKTVTTQDFLREVKKVVKFDIEDFEKQWLKNPQFPMGEAYELLLKNKFIKQYLDLQKERSKSLAFKKEDFKKIILSDAFYPLKEEVIYQLQKESIFDKKELLLLAIQQKDPKIDLAIAYTTEEIHESIRSDYEQLMDSESYRAQELVAFKLWRQYPEHSVRYLEHTKNRKGLYNHNLELQWLYMAIVTRGYHLVNLGEEVTRLIQYTQPEYDANIREIAFQYCLDMPLMNGDILRNLIQATTHHKWQFAKFAKSTLYDLMKDLQIREAIANMSVYLTPEELVQIEKLYQQLNAATKSR